MFGPFVLLQLFVLAAHGSEIRCRTYSEYDCRIVELTNLEVELKRITFYTYVPEIYKETVDAIEINSQWNNWLKIKHVPDELLATFPKLRRLYIPGGEISEISPGNFRTYRGASKLTSIKLPNNKLAMIKRNTFAELYTIEELDLGWNQIHTIESGAFNDLIKRKYLYLNDNKLKVLDDQIFDRLAVLKELRLGSNEFESIGNFLYALNSVESIRLGYNEKINDINLKKFGQLPRLKKLILFRAAVNLTNNVNDIDSMESLGSPLEVLDVGFCNLTIEAAFKLFSLFRNLTEINIGGNGIDGDAKIFKEIEKRTPLSIDFNGFSLY